jgi:hypothetical protein
MAKRRIGLLWSGEGTFIYLQTNVYQATMGSEHIWTWVQAKRRHYRVISDPERGLIEVYNERGEIVLRKENLSRRLVEMVEKNFLSSVAKRLNERSTPKSPQPPACDPFDPMIN